MFARKLPSVTGIGIRSPLAKVNLKAGRLKKKFHMKLVFSLGEPRAFSIWEKMQNYFLQTTTFFLDYNILCCHFYPIRILLRSRLLGFWALKFPSLAAFVCGRPPGCDILFHSYLCPGMQTLTILPALTSVLISY